MYTILYTRRGVRLNARFDNLHETEQFAHYVLERQNLKWQIFEPRSLDAVRENDDGKPWSWEL